jgi:HSP20 family molecular chaperone IbpA
MSRMSVFNSPLLLGFDHFERTLDRISKSTADGYPPYNIEQTSSDGIRITLAVAGFGSDELSVQIEDNQLVIRGRQIEEDDRIYLHRGIAARQFLRTFVLAEGIEVQSADLDNGLLHIDLRRPMPEVKVQTIEINAGKKPAASNTRTKLDVERAD